MKTFSKQAAQGDLLLVRVEGLPAGLERVEAEGGGYVVAHSETGHHHTVFAAPGVEYYRVPTDPMTCYLSVGGAGVELVHHRPHDTHESIQLSGGTYLLRRQREWTPEGLRMVQD